MALPTGYFYKDGAYWKTDGTGPYQFDGVETMTLLDLGGGQTAGASDLIMQNGRYFKINDGSGPWTVGE